MPNKNKGGRVVPEYVEVLRLVYQMQEHLAQTESAVVGSGHNGEPEDGQGVDQLACGLAGRIGSN